MIEPSYTECTSSVVTALAVFRKHVPGYREDQVKSVDS